jgi:hypothetical protein
MIAWKEALSPESIARPFRRGQSDVRSFFVLAAGIPQKIVVNALDSGFRADRSVRADVRYASIEIELLLVRQAHLRVMAD